LAAVWVRKTPCGLAVGPDTDDVVLEALTYQDPDEAPLDEDDLSTLDIVPHPVPSKGLFGCGLWCDDEFVGSLEEVAHM